MTAPDEYIPADDPRYDGFRITEHLWAFVSLDPKTDQEGIASFHDGSTWVPMISADQRRVDSLKPVAQRIATMTGSSIRLVKFERVAVIDEIEPGE